MVKEHFTVNESSRLSLKALIQGLCLSWADSDGYKCIWKTVDAVTLYSK